jgi:hypothetical protein
VSSDDRRTDVDNTMIEYPGGQLALAAEAVEPSGQLIIAEARPAIPTPPMIARDAVERAAVEERDALAVRTMSRAELMSKLAAPRRRGEPYRCARCDRELEPERWVYSHHTGARYCWPGEGCNRKEG